MDKGKKVNKVTKVILTVEAEIDNSDADFDFLSSLQHDLMNELVKVKSGTYENRVCGYITSVQVEN